MTMEKSDKDVMVRAMRIVNASGVHARPAAIFAKVASGFDSLIFVQKGKTRVSGKSLMGLLSLGAECGAEITVTAQGDDAQEALDRLQKLVDESFESGG